MGYPTLTQQSFNYIRAYTISLTTHVHCITFIYLFYFSLTKRNDHRSYASNMLVIVTGSIGSRLGYGDRSAGGGIGFNDHPELLVASRYSSLARSFMDRVVVEVVVVMATGVIDQIKYGVAKYLLLAGVGEVVWWICLVAVPGGVIALYRKARREYLIVLQLLLVVVEMPTGTLTILKIVMQVMMISQPSAIPCSGPVIK